MTNKARWFLSNLDHTVHCYFSYHKFSHQTKTNTVGHDRDQTWVYTNIEIRLNHVQFYPSAFLYSFAVLTWSFSVVLNNQFDVSFASVWYKSYVAEALTITWPTTLLNIQTTGTTYQSQFVNTFPRLLLFLNRINVSREVFVSNSCCYFPWPKPGELSFYTRSCFLCNFWIVYKSLSVFIWTRQF